MKKKVVVIGGGPAGIHSAISFSKAGCQVVLVERESIGGTCINRGCVPTRAYLQAVKAREQMSGIQIDWQELKIAIAKKIQRINNESEYLLRKNKVELIHGEGNIAGNNLVEIKETGEKISCDMMVFATGSKPREIAVKTTSGGRAYSTNELLMQENVPEEITVIGGGILGIEMAVILNAMGVNTTIVEKQTRILPTWDEDVSNSIAAYLSRQGIKVKLGIQNPSPRNYVICCGRMPIIPQISNCNVDATKLALIGDCTGLHFLADKAIEEGRTLAQIISGKEVKPYEVSSTCLFTPLEAAMCGMTKEEMEVQGLKCIEKYYPIDSTCTGRIFDINGGFIKVIIEEKTDLLKGFHIVSAHATEIISAAQIAVNQQMTCDNFVANIFPHPTEAELLKEAVLGA